MDDIKRLPILIPTYVSRNVGGYSSYDMGRGKRLHRCTRSHLYCVRTILVLRYNKSSRRSEQALITLGMVTPVIPHPQLPYACETFICRFPMLGNHAVAIRNPRNGELASLCS